MLTWSLLIHELANAPIHTDLDGVAKIVQRNAHLGLSLSQTLRATIAHPCMTSDNFLGLKSLWIVDSGATNHMTSNKSILSGLVDISQPPRSIANGYTYNIEGIGFTKF